MTAPSTDPVALRPRATAERPLSRIQQLIWASQRLSPSAPLANMGKVHRIAGALDPDRFVAAFGAVVAASDALRTVVLERPGAQPVARILATAPGTTTVIDLPAADLEAWCDARIATPVDATVCAFDSVLIRHAADDWTWWLDLHHVVTDAFASALVFETTARAYSGAADLGLVDLGDHLAASRPTRPADDAGLADRLAFWSMQSGDEAPIAPYGPRGRRTSRVSRLEVALRDDLGPALAGPYRTISRELGLLVLMSITTASLLHRLDGRPAVTLGVPIHHRSGPDAPRVIGPLMELYPLRIVVDPAESFTEAFGRVHRDLVTVLRTARPGESPDTGFDAVVNVLTARFGEFAGLPTQTRWARSGHVDPAHPIRVQVYDYGDGLRVELDVNDGLSADGSHLRLADHLAAALAAAVATPDRRTVDVDLVTADERIVLAALNPPAPAGPALRPVHRVIAERLRAAPDRVTAECDGIELTGGDLDRRAAVLAGLLRRRGVGRGDRVGIRMGRSLDVLVAVHGVLRSGAAFVFLDPADPTARHEAIIADAGLRVVLDELPPAVGEDDGTAAVPDDEPADDAVLDDTAYVLYTSGSTGTPKGVPIPHRGLADYLRFAEQSYPTTAPMVMPLHSSLVFDLTITSLFLPQLVGGRTIVVGGAPLEALADVARRTDLTAFKGTPSQLELLTRMITEPLPLEAVIVGGEAFRRPVALAFAERCRPGVRIYNEYGPTEAVVGCMIHEWDPERDIGPDVPIGIASPGAEVHVLDAHGHRTPVGTWGELYVRRPGMAAGYLNLPELSAQRFGPVTEVDDQPLYRTGDRVRVEHGVLVYGGRNDDQLKFNGIRLEPGEIEAALVLHPSVANAVVRIWSPGSARFERCTRCGLGTDVPEVVIDADGVCSVCRAFERVEPRTREWFGTPDDLDAIRDEAHSRTTGPFDCLHLLSGGKDSTYALYELVARGWRVHSLTLDNGYISDGAKANISRTIADLGVSHEFVTTEAMAAIFRDSLDRFANVCNGCYKTIYTLATARAHELGIPVIVTGLSRGQFFETRLVPHQFESDRFDPEAIDRTVLQARRAYHRTTDAVTTLLPEQQVFERDDLAVLDEIRYVDFYRYVDVDLTEMLDFLEHRAPWVRPADTGRSTNCLINVVGIHVHRTERGFHNYAQPYSWDVRLGHKTRAEALDELDDEIDLAEVERILAEIGYEPKRPEVLTAWYQTVDGEPIEPGILRAHLREHLPARSIPGAFVHVDDLPLAGSAKLDASALPSPSLTQAGSRHYVPPTTPTEAIAADVWAAVLGVERVGLDDDFFDLGGSSLPALETVAAMEQATGTDLPDALVFQHRVLRDFAAAVDRHAGRGATVGPIPDLPPGDRTLGPGEEAMLFEYRTDPTDTRYNVTRLYTVGDPIDPVRLRAALDAVVGRHGPLHTAFDPDRTLLDPHVACTLEPLPDGSAEAFADAQRSVPFDLEHGPLVRVHLGAGGDGTSRLLIGMHHICVDAGTFDTFWDELDAAYHGRPLPVLTTTVAAHGAWQRQRWDESLRVWETTADRSDRRGGAVLAPPDRPEPDGYLETAAPLTTAELAEGAAATPFAASLAAAVAVLAAHSRTGEVEIGITASTKDHPAVDPLIGYFLNTVPLRFVTDPSHTLRSLDEQAGRTVAALLPHRSVPLAHIVRRCHERGVGAPDVSHMLAYERLAPCTWGDRPAEHRILASGTSVSEVTFFVQERGDLLRLGIEYRGTTVGRADAERLLRAFSEAIASVAERPYRTVAEFAATLAAPDLTGPALPSADGPSVTVLERFRAHAEQQPGAVAVVGPDGAETTYSQLFDAAGRLAARIDATAPSARRVGVAVHRSAAMVRAILAAQFAGAAYVGLDPSVPDHRLDLIVEQARLDVVVVDPTTAHRFGDLPVVDVESLDPAPLHRSPSPDDDAYVIFTSGSTGVPAGVAVTHANLAASNAARPVFYGAAPERFLLTSSIGFDSSLVGLMWPLATGGAVVVPDDDVVHDVDRLGDLVAERRISHVLMVPSLYRALLDRRAASLGSLSVAIVAGEACPPALVADHHRLLPNVELVDEYGPTEATVWASAHRCRPGDDPVPIGRPIAGVTLRIADEHHRPMPARVPGELLIAGPGVTAGYLGGRSTDAFVDVDAHRWYCTGDLVRTDADGRVLFLGRIDDQLNVGGVRVEPGEIEAVLLELAAVTDAVVVAAEVDGRAMLVAHLAVAPGAHVDTDTVRRHLAGRVLAGAVPRRIAVHPDLPRTAHGKLDRAAAARLPIGDHRSTVEAPSAADRLDRCVTIWRRALGRDDLGPDADFFAVGGDSLAAVEIVTALADLSGSEVPVAALLSSPTPLQMARALFPHDATTSSPSGADGFHLVTMRPGQPGGPLVLLTAAWDDVQGYRDLADAFDPTVRVVAAAVTDRSGRLDRVDTVADRIVSEFAAGSPTPDVVLGWSIGGVVAFEVGQRLGRAGRPVGRIALVDTYFPGEQRHIWSNRWWKYKSMLRPGSIGAAGRELRTMVGRRVRRLAASVGRRLLAWAGEPVGSDAPRTTPGGIPFAAMDHTPTPGPVGVVLFAATTTNPRRTVEPWGRIVTDLQVVRLPGRHRGHDSIMGAGRVGAICAELERRDPDVSTGSARA